MTCQNCGYNLNEGDQFCRNCGTKVIDNTLKPTEVTPQPINNIGIPQVPAAPIPVAPATQQPILASPVVNPTMQQPVAPNINVPNQQGGFVPQNQYAGQGYNMGNNTDEALLRAYVGQNYESLSNGTFSWNAFFLGIFYLGYRKMWAYAIGIMVVLSLFSIILLDYSSILGLGINILMGVKFKEIYMNNARNRVNELKMRCNGRSNEELLLLCSKAGGTSGLGVVIMIVLFGIVSAIVTSVAMGSIISQLG